MLGTHEVNFGKRTRSGQTVWFPGLIDRTIIYDFTLGVPGIHKLAKNQFDMFRSKIRTIGAILEPLEFDIIDPTKTEIAAKNRLTASASKKNNLVASVSSKNKLIAEFQR